MRVQIYRARRGLLMRKQWRARVVAANGRVLFVSAEGYNNLGDIRGIVATLFPNATPEIIVKENK